MYYGKTMIEDLACAVAKSPFGTVFTAAVDMSFAGLGAGVMGFRGVALRAGMLYDLPYWAVPAECFLADDPFITYYFRQRGYRIRQLVLRAAYKIDKSWAWSNTSINQIHVPSQCVETLTQKGTRRVSPIEAAARVGRLEPLGSLVPGRVPLVPDPPPPPPWNVPPPAPPRPLPPALSAWRWRWPWSGHWPWEWQGLRLRLRSADS